MRQLSQFKPIVIVALLLVSALTGLVVENSSTPSLDATSPSSSELGQDVTLSGMKGWFTENRGQFGDEELKYVFAGSHMAVGFVASGYLIKLTGEGGLTSVVKVSFQGANEVLPEGEKETGHRTNYLRGQDSQEWQTGVVSYQRVVYQGLYDGIDLVFYTTGEGLKYDFLVSPGADPEQIRWEYEGAEETFVDEEGRLHVMTGAGEFLEAAPFSYQTVLGERRVVLTSYVKDGARVGFEIGNYSSEVELVIDPLLYSTYLGGEGITVYDIDWGYDITTDQEGNVYVTGEMGSWPFPTTPGCYDNKVDTEWGDAFVSKFSPDGATLLFSTLLGGSDYDDAYGIAVDSSGRVYVTGNTESEDFPTTFGCYDESYNGGELGDAFLACLSQDGTELLGSTFLGGDDFDLASPVILDSGNNVYLAGTTTSTDFPTTEGCFDDTVVDQEAFVSKFNWNLSTLVFSTILGGNDMEVAQALTLDSENNVLVTGSSSSPDFPTIPGAYDTEYSDSGEYPAERLDAFVAKINHNGTELLYSSFLGGDNKDFGMAIALDEMGNIYVAGVTRSEDFPTTKGSYDETSNGGDDIFVTKLAPNGRTLVYSTFLGGSNYESFGGMAIDSGGKVYVTGSTSSSDYPVTEGCYDGSHGDYNEILVTKLSPSGSSLHYSTFVGGEGTEYGGGIALDSENNAWVTGTTTSEDFPTTEGCLDDSFGKFDDVVVFKLNLTAEEKKEEDDSGGFLPGFEIVAVSLSIAVVAFVRKRKH